MPAFPNPDYVKKRTSKKRKPQSKARGNQVDPFGNLSWDERFRRARASDRAEIKNARLEIRKRFFEKRYTPPPPPTGGDPSSKRKKSRSVGPKALTTVPVNSNAYATVDPAIKQLYIKEIKRLTLTLIKSSKDLLLSYNFSSINKVPSYYLDSDTAARSSAVFTESATPQSLAISINELDNNRLMTDIVNTINLSISDYVVDTVKMPYFTMVISGGSVFYDLNIPITTQDTTPFYVKVFKIPDATGVV